MDGIKRRRSLRIPAKASVWYIASSAFARSISVVGTPIFTRLLDAEEYGIFPRYMTYFSLVSVIATLELSGGVILRGLQKFEDKSDGFISSAVGLTSCVWAVISLLLFTFSAIFGDFIGLGRGFILVMLVHILLNAIISIYTAEAKFRYKYRLVALVNIATSVLTPAVSVLFIAAFGSGGYGRIYAAVLSAGAVALPFLYIIFKRSKRLYDGDVWRFLLRFNLPLLPHYLFSSVIIRIGEVALSHLHGTAALAKYSVAMSVGLSLTVITNGLLSALSPWVLRRIRAGEIGRMRSLLFYSTALLSLIALLILSIVPETIRIIAPPEYHECLFAVYPLALSVVPSFLSSAVVSGELYYERSGVTSIPTVVAGVVAVVLTLLLSPIIDYRLVAVFVPIAYSVSCLLNCYIFRRMSGEAPVDLRSCSLVYLFTVGYAMLSFSLRGYLIARLLLAVPLLFPLYKIGRRIYGEVQEAA